MILDRSDKNFHIQVLAVSFLKPCRVARTGFSGTGDPQQPVNPGASQSLSYDAEPFISINRAGCWAQVYCSSLSLSVYPAGKSPGLQSSLLHRNSSRLHLVSTKSRWRFSFCNNLAVFAITPNLPKFNLFKLLPSDAHG